MYYIYSVYSRIIKLKKTSHFLARRSASSTLQNLMGISRLYIKSDPLRILIDSPTVKTDALTENADMFEKLAMLYPQRDLNSPSVQAY